MSSDKRRNNFQDKFNSEVLDSETPIVDEVLEVPVVAITAGDTNGVGYEVVMKTFAEPAMTELCTPIIYGNPKTMAYHRKALGIEVNYNVIQRAEEARAGRLNLLAVNDDELKIEFGQSSAEAGMAALQSLETAVADYREGKFDVLVTAPINKHSIQSDDFHFPGHTEYIEQRLGNGDKALMILMNEKVRVALATTHLPIANVAEALTTEGILDKVRLLQKTLCRDFLITRPRIAVLALNPHAGDDGLLGKEEKEIILPAIDQANAERIDTYGPFPADGFFGSAAYEHYDAILAMYHDQGLAPFKVLAMDDGVNYTAGLPIVRTSPDHGTAYDIAGKGVADENSFRQALYLAIDVFRNRQRYDEAYADPLPKLYHERREDERRERHRNPFPQFDGAGENQKGVNLRDPRSRAEHAQNNSAESASPAIAESKGEVAQPEQPAAEA